ncbi:winged helix DNA-binding domain-containing protein [Streptomyces durmitorensis]|uniref:Winged helix DNA-binding domain-containing protein n=1 Tax=Streptomyces durmitorensis TaxID=319947 RepID=A0ABY4PTR9_9ACTN|nr:winged helix DNA-binding domain-containing protein [Streptomyces durmitorensis]UQT56599.1 winged helix DNA-binding domain-containing protein [Streptomyces durmitorensis]
MTVAAISWSAANARRMERQFLLNPAKPGQAGPGEVVDAMLAAHAQVMSAAELSVGLRMDGATRLDVRDALWGEEPSLVKTYGPRGTIHFLPVSELPMWTGALSAVPGGPSPFKAGDRLTPSQTDEIVGAIGEALDGACLTIDELSDEVVARTGPWAGDLVLPAFQGMWPRWRSVMHVAGHRGVLCFAPNRGRKVTYTRPSAAGSEEPPLSAEVAAGRLVRRFLYAYGPATSPEFAKWAAAPARWAGEVFASLASAGEIEAVEMEGVPSSWVVAGDTEFPAEPVRGVRLLPYFDAYVIASHPRERLFPGRAYERALAGGQAGNFPVLLVDGIVAGVWHQRRSGRRITVTVEPLGSLNAGQERELEGQAERVGEVLEGWAELVVGPVAVGAHA